MSDGVSFLGECLEILRAISNAAFVVVGPQKVLLLVPPIRARIIGEPAKVVITGVRVDPADLVLCIGVIGGFVIELNTGVDTFAIGPVAKSGDLNREEVGGIPASVLLQL